MACPDCFRGVLSKEEYTGSIETVHGFPTYISRPSGAPRSIVVIMPDAFGWTLTNTRVLADAIASEAGYLVYLPDLMDGKAPGVKGMVLIDRFLHPSGWWEWLMKPFIMIRALTVMVPFMMRVKIPAVNARAVLFFRGIRNDPETKGLKVGACAYCFTAPTMAYLASNPDGEDLVDAVFTAHPSKVNGSNFENVKKPVSIAIGDKDMATKLATVREIEAVLKKKEGEVDSQVVIFPGAEHGFGVRGDWTDPEQKANCQGALKQLLDWFAKHFKT